METEEQNKFLVPLAIVVAGALISAAIYFGGSKAPSSVVDNSETPKEITVPGVRGSDHIQGSASAPVVVIEYSDSECPFCKAFHSTMKNIVTSYGGQVAWVYRHFPIAQLHSKAIKEAEAAECATELGGPQSFWDFTDKVFEATNSNNSLDLAELPEIAFAIGLDKTAFSACLDSGKYNKAILASVEEAVKIGARGTPYSVIVAKDGKKDVINGAEPIAKIKIKIDALLDN